MEEVIIHTDGASRGNPGKAGIGVVIYDQNKKDVLAEVAEYIGETTNNVAEYKALIRALEEAEKLSCKRLNIYTDSDLLVKQFNGIYRVKHENLQPLFAQVKKLASSFEKVKVEHVRREYNKDADKLANQGVDKSNFL